MFHYLCNLYLVFKGKIICIKHLLPKCLRLFNLFVVEFGGFGRKEVNKVLAQVYFIVEEFHTKIIIQQMEEVVIAWHKVISIRWMARRPKLLYGIPDHPCDMQPGIVMEEKYTFAIHRCWLLLVQYMFRTFQLLQV